MPSTNLAPTLLIDGRLGGADSGATRPDVDPFTEQVVASVPEAGIAEVERAVAAADRAFRESGWRTDTALRAHCLRQLADGLSRHAEVLREVVVSEAGAPIAMTRDMQVDGALRVFSGWADIAAGYAYETEMAPVTYGAVTSRRLLVREPVGVAALITPYNYPLNMVLTKLGPALAAGNTVVLKPSPLTPWVAALVGYVAATETDLPPGVLNVITSTEAAVSEALVAHRDVAMISFTGSTAVGRSIMASAAGRVKKVLLELGGKSAHVVLDDADLEAAVRFTVQRMSRHSGQGCTNLTRLLLPRGQYEHGLEIAKSEAGAVRWGDPREPDTNMGPQISRQAQQRVLGHVRTALDEGGRLVAGGGVPAGVRTGYFVEPTIVADVHPDATLAQEETFGPVLAVLPYDGDDDAVRIANNSDYGLSGAVTGGDDDRAIAVARRITTGTIDVNGATYFAPDTPFGGLKQSGLGKEWGIAGFEEFLELRVLGVPDRS
jgi:aldehyde dehydrogenase (NAD+)